MKKRILIVFTYIGYGHKVISENIAESLKSDFDVDLLNLFDLEKGGALADRGSKVYLWMVNNWPGLWNFFYTNKIFLAATLPFRRTVGGWKSGKMQKFLVEKRRQGIEYDAILCAHANASAITSYLKEKGLFKGKFIVTF